MRIIKLWQWRWLWRRFVPYQFRAWGVPAIIGIALGAAGFAVAHGGFPADISWTEPVSSAPEPRAAQLHQGMRVRVIDGDTIEDLGTGERIRLPNIDTPETGERAQCRAERQAGEAATRAAREITSGSIVTVQRTGRIDQYGRTIGFVLVDGRDLGVTLMERGLARPWRGRREPWCGPDGRLLTGR